MTLDVTKPTDSDLVSSFAGYLRETRTQVNTNTQDIESIGVIPAGKNIDLEGVTVIRVGTGEKDVSTAPIETIFLTGSDPQNFENIEDCKTGQIKIFFILSDNLTFIKDVTKFDLNGDVNFTANQYDVIAFVNQGGDGIVDDGVWIELFRNINTRT
jgi:hypothetical protein